METFAFQTENKQAKQLYSQTARQTQAIVGSLESRVQQLEQKELQY